MDIRDECDGSTWNTPSMLASYESDLIIKDAARIDHGVRIVTTRGVDRFELDEAEEVADASSGEMASSAASQPDRLSALATVPLRPPKILTKVLKPTIKMGLNDAAIYSTVASGRLDCLGIDRVLLGSDYPFCQMPTATVVLGRLHLSAEHRDKIEHENAFRLFGTDIPASRAD